MSDRRWSDAYANAADLADALVALNLVSLRFGVADALRNGGKGRPPDALDRLADDCDELAALVAKRGMYDAFVIVTDAAEALRELAGGEVETWGDDTMTVEVVTLRPDDPCYQCAGAGCSACTDAEGLPL